MATSVPQRLMAAPHRLDSPSARAPSDDDVRDGLAAARGRTLALVAPISDADLERAHSSIMSPLVWDLGHIAAYEDLWLGHRFGGLELLRPDLAALYDAFETPRAVRGDIEILDRAGALAYMDEVRARTLAVIERAGVGDGHVHEMVVQHEHQHNETMLQTLGLARLPGALAGNGPVGRTGARAGVDWVEVGGGPFALGAPAGRFAYDNELPRHEVDVSAFRIARLPVTNASWLTFAEGGGYERREWWSDEGWAWKEEYDIERPGGWEADVPVAEVAHEWHGGAWEPLDPDRPVVHVSWFEADAFARAHGARLPTEAEWEKAATWDQETGATLDWPWGVLGIDSSRANLAEDGRFGCVPAGSLPAGAAPCGAVGMIGDVWEWTSSSFTGYPGFAADPYPEYSVVFFDAGYRSLRGGSWATSRRVATPTFRNWDLPMRRQIFAGVRLATDWSQP